MESAKGRSFPFSPFTFAAPMYDDAARYLRNESLTPPSRDSISPLPRRSVSYESGLLSSDDIMEPKPMNYKGYSRFNARATPFEPLNGPNDDRRWSSGSGTSYASLPSRMSNARTRFHDTSFEDPALPGPVSILQPRKPRKNRNRRKNAQSYAYSHNSSRRSQAHSYEQADTNSTLQQGLFDPYMSSASPIPSAAHTQHQPQMNPYAQDPGASSNPQYFQANSYSQPLQYHLYTPLGPHRENLLPYQRAAHDFFISDSLREDLQRKSAAALQTLPSM